MEGLSVTDAVALLAALAVCRANGDKIPPPNTMMTVNNIIIPFFITISSSLFSVFMLNQKYLCSKTVLFS
jgi:hypothetical protein